VSPPLATASGRAAAHSCDTERPQPAARSRVRGRGSWRKRAARCHVGRHHPGPV